MERFFFWLGLRPVWLGLRPGWMAQRGEQMDGRMDGRTDGRTDGQTNERKISPFYRTSSPIGAVAQKEGRTKAEVKSKSIRRHTNFSLPKFPLEK